MIQRVTHTSIYVNDIDEALAFYVNVLGFEKKSDAPMEGGNRWVSIGLSDQPDFEVVLQPAHWGPEEMTAEERAELVGKQPGFILETDDIEAETAALKSKGVMFLMEPQEFPWGKNATFKDLYGNVHVLSQTTM